MDYYDTFEKFGLKLNKSGACHGAAGTSLEAVLDEDLDFYMRELDFLKRASKAETNDLIAEEI